MAEDNGPTEGGVTTPLGSFSFKGKRTAEFITILVAFIMVGLLVLYWKHEESSKHTNEAVARAIDKTATAIDGQTAAQRMTGCLIWMRREPGTTYASARAECEQITR
jgi:hypothetical protein